MVSHLNLLSLSFLMCKMIMKMYHGCHVEEKNLEQCLATVIAYFLCYDAQSCMDIINHHSKNSHFLSAQAPLSLMNKLNFFCLYKKKWLSQSVCILVGRFLNSLACLGTKLKRVEGRALPWEFGRGQELAWARGRVKPGQVERSLTYQWETHKGYIYR